MKLVCNITYGGVTSLRVVTTANGNQGLYVKAIAGVGNPFWIWPTVPAGKVIAADFTNAPIVDADPIVNNQRIAAITATPEDVLTYAPAE
ncbi:hypothetical protein [Neorhizobium galegae]|uniref:hypothetical protein n=1 Tax=Neorhizobium galegae TaxID=399 RepID=UPI002102C9B1|nr:hypothetical protein [Neorhizobium galegae]MCQ1850373.1 hypothetical protein [Neorhizobium galegae]